MDTINSLLDFLYKYRIEVLCILLIITLTVGYRWLASNLTLRCSQQLILAGSDYSIMPYDNITNTINITSKKSTPVNSPT